jgi:hypothetical protein
MADSKTGCWPDVFRPSGNKARSSVVDLVALEISTFDANGGKVSATADGAMICEATIDLDDQSR